MEDITVRVWYWLDTIKIKCCVEYLKKKVLEIFLQSLKGITKQTEHLISARWFELDQESALQAASMGEMPEGLGCLL